MTDFIAMDADCGDLFAPTDAEPRRPGARRAPSRSGPAPVRASDPDDDGLMTGGLMTEGLMRWLDRVCAVPGAARRF